VIAGRGRNHAARLLLGIQRSDGIRGAAQFEAAGCLAVFELEMDRDAKTIGKTLG
jgi:hypothetical protein